MKGWVVLAVLGGIALSGCKSSGPAILQISGHYEGSLLTHLDGDYRQNSVRTDITRAGSAYAINDAVGSPQLTLNFGNLTDSSLTIQSSQLLSQPITLNYNPKQGCYSAKTESTASLAVTLCATSPEITFEIDDARGDSLLSLVLYHFAQESDQAAQEQPQSFALSAAIDRARNTSFEAKIEFEHVIQAKGLANAAYLHLLPQLTLGTVASSISLSFSSILGAISDLAPFLLPSRWLKAEEAADRSQAELDAEQIMKLDMGAEVEGLFYSYDRDRRSLAVYSSVSQKVDGIYAEVQRLEAAGVLPLGSADNIRSVELKLQHSIDVFNQVLAEDRSAISQSLGFFSPLAVQDATIDQEPFPIDHAPAVDFQSVSNSAISRSFELDQMDWLISAAHAAKVEENFDWLDPAGDPNLGLGAALPAEIEVAQSRINELMIDRDQVKSTISQKAFNAVTDYNQALQAYALENESAMLQTRRLDENLAQLDAGVRIEIATLLDVLSDYTDSLVQIEVARANYRVARSEIDRLLLQGFYARF